MVGLGKNVEEVFEGKYGFGTTEREYSGQIDTSQDRIKAAGETNDSERTEVRK